MRISSGMLLLFCHEACFFLSSLKGKLLGVFYITKRTKKKIPDVCAPLCFLRFTGRINVVICCKLSKHRSVNLSRHYIEPRH